jgi:hypothetical protein
MGQQRLIGCFQAVEKYLSINVIDIFPSGRNILADFAEVIIIHNRHLTKGEFGYEMASENRLFDLFAVYCLTCNDAG